MVRLQSSMFRKTQRSEAGAQKENIKKNRYKDILPYDESRVVLTLRTSDSDGDYINASFIQGALPGHCSIAAQAPLGCTLTDFWRMIWQHSVKVIVMACREFEMAKKKCECYWAALNQTSMFGPFTVHSQGESNPTEDIIIREFTVSFKQEQRAVTQLQFLSWPDHDVPYEASGVLELLHRVRTVQGNSSSPKLIHCSAGCGRTGVICVLDQIYHLLLNKQLTADFSIMRLVLDLRRQRPSAVQTKEQYQFIFRATSCLFRQFLQKSFSQTYSNVSEPKTPQKRLPAAASHRSQQENMDVTYAVVNKIKTNQSESSSSQVAVPRSTSQTRTKVASHHYDNELSVTSTPIYSVVRPRSKSHLSEAHLYDLATPTDYDIKPQNHLLSDPSESVSESENTYEDVSASDSSSFPSAAGLGFNCRIQKPRGPRDPPPEWSRLER